MLITLTIQAHSPPSACRVLLALPAWAIPQSLPATMSPHQPARSKIWLRSGFFESTRGDRKGYLPLPKGWCLKRKCAGVSTNILYRLYGPLPWCWLCVVLFCARMMSNMLLLAGGSVHLPSHHFTPHSSKKGLVRNPTSPDPKSTTWSDSRLGRNAGASCPTLRPAGSAGLSASPGSGEQPCAIMRAAVEAIPSDKSDTGSLLAEWFCRLVQWFVARM